MMDDNNAILPDLPHTGLPDTVQVQTPYSTIPDELTAQSGANDSTLYPDLAAAQYMLQLLDPAPDAVFTFQTFDDNADRKERRLAITLHGTLDQHQQGLTQLMTQGAGVFVTVNQTSGRRTAKDVTRVRALFVDFDSARPERLQELAELDTAPTMIIESSPGKHHAYWIIDQQGDIPLDQFKPLQQRLIDYFTQLWPADGVDNGIHDLPRVMRLAGFYHQKVKAEKGQTGQPVMVRVAYQMDHYTAQEVMDWVASLPVSEPVAPEKSKKKPQANATPEANNRPAQYITFEQAKLLARGHWPQILAQLGYPVTDDPDQHTACPACGGSDRFRFDNQNGDGSFICSQGDGDNIAGDGFALLEHAGNTPAQALQMVTGVLDQWDRISPYDAQQTAQHVAPPVTQWPEPRPISQTLHPVLPFSGDMLPAELSRYVFDEAGRADNSSPDYVAVALLVSLGSLIGARVAIKPKRLDDWEQVANLWGGLCAPPSKKKSPALNAALKPLNKLIISEKERIDRENKDSKNAETNQKAVLLSNDGKIKALRGKLGQIKLTDDERLEIAQEIAKLEALQDEAAETPTVVAEKRYKTDDSTPEALADLEKDNPNGILVYRDELIGLLANLDKDGHDNGRAFYLEGWNGTGSYQIDRIMRGASFIENHCLSLLGGIQPDKLMTYLDDTIRGGNNDGLLQRFQLLVYPDQPQWEFVDKAPDTVTRDEVYALFAAIDQLTPRQLVKMGARPADQYNKRPFFHFDQEAQELFKQWMNQLHKEIIPREQHGIIAEHLSKYPSLMTRLALIFHIIHVVQTGVAGSISRRSAEMAIDWCRYLETHARRIYGLVIHSTELRAATLLEKLKTACHTTDWQTAGFTARQIQQREWQYLTDRETIHNALDWLADHHWLAMVETEPTVKGGRPSKRYFINPRIFENIA